MAWAVRDSTTIRIPRTTHKRLKELAAESGERLADILTRAIAHPPDGPPAEARRRFWRQFNDAYARLKADPVAWAAYQAEQAEWAGTIADGREQDDDWSDLLAAGPDGVEFIEDDDASPHAVGPVATRSASRRFPPPVRSRARRE